MQSISIYPDGNCLIYALLESGLQLGTSDIQWIRYKLSEYVDDHKEFYKPFTSHSRYSIEDMIRDIRRDGNYMSEAGDLLPHVISDYTNTNINIINEDGTVTYISPRLGVNNSDNNITILRVNNSGGHYFGTKKNN